MSTFIRFDGAGIQPATFHSLTADGDVATAAAVATAVLFWLNGGHLFACEDAVPPRIGQQEADLVPQNPDLVSEPGLRRYEMSAVSAAVFQTGSRSAVTFLHAPAPTRHLAFKGRSCGGNTDRNLCGGKSRA